MDVVRSAVDELYLRFRYTIFRQDSEVAHARAIQLAQHIHRLGLAEFALDNTANRAPTKYVLSNAAGSNKNGDIPPDVLRFLGFTENKVGTGTFDQWPGNSDRPRVRRLTKMQGLQNKLGLPCIGAKRIAEQLLAYKQTLPVVLNVMATPGKQGDEELEDIVNTITTITNAFPDIEGVELNISCPNTHAGTMRTGAMANLRIFNPDATYTCDRPQLAVQLNDPHYHSAYEGQSLRGKMIYTVVNGKVWDVKEMPTPLN